MEGSQLKMDRPIRVVMFGSGPALNHDARLFLSRLELHPEIELTAAFCQAPSQSIWAVFKDLLSRRGPLAIPLMVAWLWGRVWYAISHPRMAIKLQQVNRQLRDRIHFVEDIHSDDVLEKLRSIKPDLGLVYGSPILKRNLFELPAYGTLGIHHGKVPQYRGNKTTFWAMYNGEDKAGVTIQKINAGLDTGQIVKEGEVLVGGRSLGSVWRELEALGLELYVQAILEVKNGTASFRPQVGARGKLYRNPTVNDLLKFWALQLKRQFKRP